MATWHQAALLYRHCLFCTLCAWHWAPDTAVVGTDHTASLSVLLLSLSLSLPVQYNKGGEGQNDKGQMASS